MEINIYEKYGKRIFDQNIGTEIGETILKNGKKVILNFNKVESISTAFWNALISKIISKNIKNNPKDFFSIKNANETVKSTFAISLQLLDYYESE